MSGTRREAYGLELERDPLERLSADDQATQREEEFLADALIEQQRQARAEAALAKPGVCSNCGQACLPAAVYCDADCRDDHEKRRAVKARTSAGRWGTGGIDA
jgi:RNA polymerase-binding transcription factor DksA